MIRLIPLDREQFGISAPYRETFIGRARQLGGEWTTVASEGLLWVFPNDVREAAETAVLECFGVPALEDSAPRAGNVRIRVTTDLSLLHKPFVVVGYTVASAHGRDSGARPGPDVAILSGHIDSGGSVKNWTTTVAEGTVVLLRDVPVAYLDALHRRKNIEVVEADQPDRAAAIAAAVNLLGRAGFTVTPEALDGIVGAGACA